MPQLVFESVLPCSPQLLWEFHASADALKALTPTNRRVEVLSDDLAVRDGALHIIRVRQFGIPLVWHARISEVDPPHGFVDTAERSPFTFWRHHHEFLAHPDGAMLRDTVLYDLPLGPIGMIGDWLFVRRDLNAMFAYRHRRTRELLTQK